MTAPVRAPDLFDLSGRTALISGASRGIGAAAARALAHHGAAVAVNCLPTPPATAAAQQLAHEIEAAGGRCAVLPADVTDGDAVRAMVADCERLLGPVDVLIANAADIRPAEWEGITREDWDAVMAVNATGTFLCAHAAYASMARRGGGSIVTVSSVTTRLGHGGSVAYVASKGAVVGFTRALARVGGPQGIRVNSVMPGAIRTEAVAEIDPGPAEELIRVQCLQRRGVAEDVAGAFVYLASPASAFVTGQVLVVDGGLIHY